MLNRFLLCYIIVVLQLHCSDRAVDGCSSLDFFAQVAERPYKKVSRKHRLWKNNFPDFCHFYLCDRTNIPDYYLLAYTKCAYERCFEVTSNEEKVPTDSDFIFHLLERHGLDALGYCDYKESEFRKYIKKNEARERSLLKEECENQCFYVFQYLSVCEKVCKWNEEIQEAWRVHQQVCEWDVEVQEARQKQ